MNDRPLAWQTRTRRSKEPLRWISGSSLQIVQGPVKSELGAAVRAMCFAGKLKRYPFPRLYYAIQVRTLIETPNQAPEHPAQAPESL